MLGRFFHSSLAATLVLVLFISFSSAGLRSSNFGYKHVHSSEDSTQTSEDCSDSEDLGDGFSRTSQDFFILAAFISPYP